MNKQDLLHKIKDLQGLTNDEKAILINLVNTNKKYGLVWEDKPEDVEEELLTKLPVLIEDKSKFIEGKPIKAKENLFTAEEKNQANQTNDGSDNFPNHILIEGDNLHALTALTFTHENKIDVIYIDPPYNTGNKDFKYNDHFVDKEDSFRHSQWLSFMAKRLKLAKRLLKDTGVIFISINDNEVAQLKLLCEENSLFGEDNFIANLIWSNKEGGGSSDSKHFRIKHEYILCFSKNINNLILKGVDITNRERYTSKDEFEQVRGPYYLQKLGMGSIQYSTSLDYKIKTPDGTYTTASENNSGKKACWRWSVKKLEWGLQNSFVEFKKDKNGVWIVYTKQYLNCDNEGNFIERSQRPFGVIDSFSSTQASKNLEEIGLAKLFNYSKPISLINYLFQIATKEDSAILDFFAGSGTTLHSTMQLNAEDGGKRQCILVTNNENKIAEEVCYERNKRVINGYKKANSDNVEGLTNNNLRYFKTAFVGREKTTKNKKEITQLATELLCIKEDCYKEIKAPKNIRLFAENKKRFMVIYDDNVIPKAIEVINSLSFEVGWGAVKVYVFSEGQDPYTEDFIEVADKVSLCALPDAIYKAYLHVLPKKSRKGIPHIEEIIPVAENGSAQLTMDINN